MNLSRYEQETIINFNEEERTAEVYTYNGKLKRRLAELVQTRPAEVEHVRTDGTGAATYNIPKQWVKITPTRILSEETKALYTERINKARLTKKSL